MLYRPKLLYDILNELFEPGCTISSRDVQVLFVSRDLYIQTHTRNNCSVSSTTRQKNHHPRSPYAR